jgi:hypothetical protein
MCTVSINIEVDELIGFPGCIPFHLAKGIARMLVKLKSPATDKDAILEEEHGDETRLKHGARA